MAVYQLPKKQTASEATMSLKPVSGSPDSELYTITRAASGAFHVIAKSSNVVQYTATKKEWAIEWVLLNDSSIEREEVA